jgi:hypothetical protein
MMAVQPKWYVTPQLSFVLVCRISLGAFCLDKKQTPWETTPQHSWVPSAIGLGIHFCTPLLYQKGLTLSKWPSQQTTCRGVLPSLMFPSSIFGIRHRTLVFYPLTGCRFLKLGTVSTLVGSWTVTEQRLFHIQYCCMGHSISIGMG